MKLTAKDINSIAQDLEAGMKVFLNRETLEYKFVPNWDDMDNTELWDDEIEEVENEWTDYVVFTKMDSHEAFQIMVDFTDTVTDEELKEDLSKILDRKSPFANFKYEIESSSHRQKCLTSGPADTRNMSETDWILKT